MNFAILAPPRTGTTMLVKMLDQHPEICCHGEIYHPRADVRARERSLHEGRRITGCKVVFDHLETYNLWGEVTAANVITIRRNPLESLVSFRQAIETGNWKRRIETPRPVSITASELFLWSQFLERCYERVRKIGPVLELQHDRLADPATTQSVCEFLDVAQIPLSPTTKRLTHLPLSQRVRDLHQLRSETPASLQWVFNDVCH